MDWIVFRWDSMACNGMDIGLDGMFIACHGWIGLNSDGMAWIGFDWMAWHGMAWQWHGMAWQGIGMHGWMCMFVCRVYIYICACIVSVFVCVCAGS